MVGLLQGLAGGTLLYITFFEVLEREKLEKIGMTGLLGCFLIILGFGLMAGLEATGKKWILVLQFIRSICSFHFIYGTQNEGKSVVKKSWPKIVVRLEFLGNEVIRKPVHSHFLMLTYFLF